jgi:DNA-binding response OmpR family regulator
MQIDPHILFADDDADTREIVQMLLRHAGFQVSVASSLREVMALIAALRFDAIVLDNWMPEFTGIDICHEIRKHDQSTPIVFCSGALTKFDIEAAKLAGAQGYIAKPFDPDELVETLRTAIGLVQKSAAS